MTLSSYANSFPCCDRLLAYPFQSSVAVKFLTTKLSAHTSLHTSSPPTRLLQQSGSQAPPKVHKDLCSWNMQKQQPFLRFLSGFGYAVLAEWCVVISIPVWRVKAPGIYTGLWCLYVLNTVVRIEMNDLRFLIISTAIVKKTRIRAHYFIGSVATIIALVSRYHCKVQIHEIDNM